MKRKDLISKIISMGCVFLRYGSNHDLYQNPKTGKNIQVTPKKLPFFKVGKELKERVDKE